MDIYWFGQAFFKIKAKNVNLLIDPFNPDVVGLKLPKELSTDVVLVSHDHPDHNNKAAIPDSPFIFSGPGEYEIKGAVITGIGSYHDTKEGTERGKNTIFHILVDDLNIVHLGDFGQSKLTEEQIAQISTTDILLIPVGGVYTIDAKAASEIVVQLEPKIIIPMHYKVEGLKFELDEVEKFLKEMGAENIQPQAKLAISKDKLPEEPTVMVLSNG